MHFDWYVSTVFEWFRYVDVARNVMFFVLQRAWTYLPAFTVVRKEAMPTGRQRRNRDVEGPAIALRLLLQLADEDASDPEALDPSVQVQRVRLVAVERSDDDVARKSFAVGPPTPTTASVVGTLTIDLLPQIFLAVAAARALERGRVVLALRDRLRIELHVLREVDDGAVRLRRLVRARRTGCLVVVLRLDVDEDLRRLVLLLRELLRW